MCIATAIEGGRSWWVAPTYKVANVGWRLATRLCLKIPGAIIRRGEKSIQFPDGGEFWVRSADNPDSLVGEGLDMVVIDECALIKEDAWIQSLRPALSDRKGKAIFISTPRGHNWFWRVWQRGNDSSFPTWKSWRFPTTDNPYIDDAEIEAARHDMPDRTFRQEYNAEFIDDAGGIFRMVTEAATAESQTQAIDGHQYIFGIDWAYSVDFTVVAVVNVTTRSLVHYDRFNGVDYTTQRGRIAGLAKRFKPISIIAESNAMGQPNNEELRKTIGHLVTVTDFHTSNTTKASIIQSLAGAFERGDIKIINDAVLIGELQAYEGKRLEGGRVKYSAPSGMHDDTVIALALAWSGVSDGWLAW